MIWCTKIIVTVRGPFHREQLSRAECAAVLAFDAGGIAGADQLARPSMEPLTLQFVGKAVASRFGSARSSSGAIPDAVS